MARALFFSNGRCGVSLNDYGFVDDFYYPYIGLENHVAGHDHKIGVMVNGDFRWLDDGSWDVRVAYKPNTMVGYVIAKNEELQVSIVMEDTVYNETDVFLRKVEIYNHGDTAADIKIFFHQVFLISESKKRNTAFYDPTHNSVVHYKGKRVFVVKGITDQGEGIDQYSVGAYQSEGKEGTWRDAEDGKLERNAVEHGNADSTIRFCTGCDGGSKSTIYYWIAAGKSLDDAYERNAIVEQKTVPAMLHSTEEFWRAWFNEHNFDLSVVSEDMDRLFATSLFMLRAHTDNRGGIIASSDSHMIEYGKDDYNYVWPRDAAHVSSVLDRAGYDEATKPFFEFAHDVLHDDGYLHHRFRSDRSLGSTWHSTTAQHEWLEGARLQLPIQEDETAGTLVALWEHFEHTRDIEFIEELYKPMIEKMAEFLTEFRHKDTDLPLPSYDLWEEVIGVSTYTCAATYGGLMAASRFCELLGKRNRMRRYREAAYEIKDATLEHLYCKDIQSFVRYGKHTEEGAFEYDRIVDISSLYGLWKFKMLDIGDERFQNTWKRIDARLKNPGATGGYIRYENDAYFRDYQKSNPWIITTLWMAQLRLQQLEVSQDDIEYVLDTLDWVVKHQYHSGLLSEQLEPDTGAAKSATPLTWSHAVYVETVLMLSDFLDGEE